MSINKPRLVSTLSRHEGIRRFPYKDSEGIWTIGVGRNLEDRGLSAEEIEFLLSNDIAIAHGECLNNVDGFRELNGPRQEVVVNMVFNLGWPRFRTFRLFRHFLYVQDYDRAAEEMLDSKWAEQVGRRARELAVVMRTGRWDNGI